MPPVELIRSKSLSESVPYAYAASSSPGARLICFAGACPIDERGSVVGGHSFQAQTLAAFQNLMVALNDAGATVADLISTRLLVVSPRREDLLEAWSVFRAEMGDHDAPSTLIGVTVLGYQDQLVEIEAMATVSD